MPGHATSRWTMPSWAMLCHAELCPKTSVAMPGSDKTGPTSSQTVLCQVKPSHHWLCHVQGCQAGLSHAKPCTQLCCAVLLN